MARRNRTRLRRHSTETDLVSYNTPPPPRGPGNLQSSDTATSSQRPRPETVQENSFSVARETAVQSHVSRPAPYNHHPSASHRGRRLSDGAL